MPRRARTRCRNFLGLNLMGFDGQSINVNTADPATVVRGINSIADDDLRAKGQKLYKTLTETPGSRFYGESTDGVGDFLESANLTKSEYREKTDDYQSLFYGDGAHRQEDAQNYLDARQEIEESEYSAYAKAQLTAALDKAYQGITGTATPSARAADTAIEEGDRKQETGRRRKARLSGQSGRRAFAVCERTVLEKPLTTRQQHGQGEARRGHAGAVRRRRKRRKRRSDPSPAGEL